MKKFFLTIVYATLCYIPLLFLKDVFGFSNSWWLDLLLIGFSYFTGSFVYTQIHGIQVMELQHLGSNMGTHKFQVIFKIRGYGLLNIVGEYIRVEQYSNLVLQGKIFKTVNVFPSNGWVKDFASDRNEKVLSISVIDYDQPHPLNFTQITLEKYDQNGVRVNQNGLKTKSELEKEFVGLSKYEIGMKLWNQEQELLAKAREEGLEDQLIAYWEAQGRPKMKSPPKKDDYS